MKIALLALTDAGKTLAGRLCRALPDATLLTERGKVAEILKDNWSLYDGFICIMAAGIVVRGISPLLRNKQKDPCIVVMDQGGNYSVSLLSGHLGGGNELARLAAKNSGGQAVITTASDVTGHTALDLWARDHNLVVADKNRLTAVMAVLVNQARIHVFTEVKLNSWPADFQLVDDPETADLLISFHTQINTIPVHLHPRNLVLGAGCNRGTAAQAFETSLVELCERHNLARKAIRNLASIDLKQDEQGLLDFAAANNWPIDFFVKDELNQVAEASTSQAVLAATGAKGVAEPAAVLSAKNGKLLIRKEKWQDVTLAVAVAG